MLYQLHELHRVWLDPVAAWSGATARALGELPGMSALAANPALVHRLARRYEKRPFGVGTVSVAGGRAHVTEEVVDAHPFCQLRRFARTADDAEHQRRLDAAPRVLLCAPLSGHHATLLRETVRALLHDHDVYVTDWVDARDVPIARGALDLAGYVGLVQRFVRHLGASELHVVSVCQPTVPVLAAVSLMAQAGEPAPRSLTLMGGPIDVRRSPTQVNRLAVERPLEWFERNMIHTVPAPYAGAGRRVYPGFLQLAAFVAMNPLRHAEAHVDYWFSHLSGRGAERATHERFYDEYNAVLDLDAPYYLETVREVFQRASLARGVLDVGGTRVDPSAIEATALLTVEGEDDDISGLGQTQAAHDLCARLGPSQRRHHVAPGCGHYGIFSGRRWRESIYPLVRDFIAQASS